MNKITAPIKQPSKLRRFLCVLFHSHGHDFEILWMSVYGEPTDPYAERAKLAVRCRHCGYTKLVDPL